MKTYQDLLAAGENELERQNFIVSAVADHKGSKAYKVAKDAILYKDGENPTIARLERIIYDMKGKAHRDMFTANHKIASNFFSFVVDQEVSYLLGNGVSFGEDATGEKLGKDFSEKVSDALESAAVQGVAYGFWNLDHLEVFPFADDDSTPGFVPLEDETDGLLKAGIRYWNVDKERPQRYTLYELDGYTEYSRDKNGNMTSAGKKPYIINERRSVVDGVEEEPGDSYPGFPIVPLRYNRKNRSELQGKRNTLDALDLVSSKMVNNVDEGNLIYWVLKNCDGMDDVDDMNFLYHLKTSHVMHADGDDGADVDAHTVEAPYVATETAIDTLTRRLYTDFQAFDSAAVSAGNQTATAIKASYVPLDLKCDKVERQVTQFIRAILVLAGIDDEPTYTRNKLVNTGEEIQSVLQCAEYLGDEYITKKLLTILGDADQLETIMEQKAAEEADRYKQMENQLEAMKNEPSGNPGQLEEGEEE